MIDRAWNAIGGIVAVSYLTAQAATIGRGAIVRRAIARDVPLTAAAIVGSYDEHDFAATLSAFGRDLL